MYRVIYIFGVDGVGKTTIAQKLDVALKEKGYFSKYQWMRFNHLCVKPVNLLGRLCGLSVRKEYPDGTEVGYHHYYRSRIFTVLYLVATGIDFLIAYLCKIKLPLLVSSKVVLVIDRFLYDSLVDGYIATKKNFLLKSPFIHKMKKFFLNKTLVINLIVDKKILRNRRPDVNNDENFDERYGLYDNISRSSRSIHTIINNDSIDTTLRTVFKLIEK